MKKVKIYTTKTCAYCPMVKKLLTSKGIDYEEMNAEIPEIREEAIKISGAMSVPITVFGTDVVVGWNPGKLMEAMRKNELI